MYEKTKQETKNQKEKQTNKTETVEKSEGESLKETIAKYVAKAVAEAKASWEKDFETRIVSEREDAARLATMSSEERAREEMERKQKDFESERQQYVSEKSEFEAAKELAAQNLPVNFAKMVADGDKEVMMENIASFKKEYMNAIEEGLSNRLKGTLPRVSKEREHAGDPFLNGLGM